MEQPASPAERPAALERRYSSPGLAGSLPLREAEEDVRVVGLLGRDFLRHVVFTSDGPRGRFRIQV